MVNDKSVNRLVEENINLVHSVLKNCIDPVYDNIADYDDLFQDGCVGLVKAAKAYNADLGYAFSTYAYRSIQNSVISKIKRTYSKAPLDSLPLYSTYDKNEQPLIETIGTEEKNMVEYMRNLNEAFDELSKNISSNSKDIIMYKYSGYTDNEIAKKLNYTKNELKTTLRIIRKLAHKNKESFAFLYS